MENNEFNNNELEKYDKYYSEDGFWQKLAKFATKAGQKVVYVALLLYYVMKSEEVSLKDKALIVSALGYLILPVDLIPDAIPILGFTDDFAALVFVFHQVKAHITDKIKAEAKAKMRDWFDTIDDSELDNATK